VGGEGSETAACLYLLSGGVERAKIGVAGDALTRAYPDRRDAVAVCEELYRLFAGRRVRGSWYRLTVAQVREALGSRATIEAPARARAAAAAAREGPLAPRRGGRVRARTQKQLAYERRRRQERTQKQKLTA